MGRKRLGMFRIRFKLVDRFLLAGMSLLVVIAMTIFIAYTNHAEKNQIDFVQLVMEKNAINQKKQFESFLNDKVALLKALADYPQIYEMDREEQVRFIYQRSVQFGFRHIFVMDMNGIGFYIEEGVTRNQETEPFFQNVKNNDIYITEPFYSDDGAMAIMTVCVSIYDKSGTKAGVLCGAIDLAKVREFIASTEMPLEGDCFVLNQSGAFVTTPNSGNIMGDGSVFDKENSEVSLIRRAFLQEDHLGGTVTLDGREYLAQVCYLPDYTWAIVQCTPMDVVVQQFENLTILQGILSVAIIMLIACQIRIIYCWYKSVYETCHDALTGCNNRLACMKMLAYLENKKTEDITIVFMDLNRFKSVNDTYGHDKGDELLRIFSRELLNSFGKIGYVCRMGGDEFVTILLNVAETELEEIWQRFCDKLVKESDGLDFDYTIASSYGYAVRRKGEDGSLEELMQLADKRMYEYKQTQK